MRKIVFCLAVALLVAGMLIGRSEALPGAIAHYIKIPELIGRDFNAAEGNGILTINSSTSYGFDNVTNLSVVVDVSGPSVFGSTRRFVAHDDGVEGDMIAHDGIYTIKVACRDVGRYQATSYATNDGKALAGGRLMPEKFERMASVAFEVMNDPNTARQ